MIRLFLGYDPREAVGFHVFLESLMRSTKEPLSITPLYGAQRDGSNAFTYARFLVPYLCDFKGTAIYLDGSDMMLRADLQELAALQDSTKAVQVVADDYQTQHRRKYCGTMMETNNEDYPRKNWSSVILWNCAHFKHTMLSPRMVKELPGSYLHRFAWLSDEDIGHLPPEWNVLIGEQETAEAKIAHFTLGIPAIPHYQDCRYAKEWALMRNHAQAYPPPP